MTEEIIIAGFGGQGVLSMGKILAYSGIMQDKEVSWMPSYGPEMRGGTANVTVIVSDERVCSPILNAFDTAVILNQQSLTSSTTPTASPTSPPVRTSTSTASKAHNSPPTWVTARCST